MNQAMRQRVWVGVVLVLAALSLALYVTNRNLRAQLTRSKTDYAALRMEVDQRARALVAETLHERRSDIVAAGYWLNDFYQAPGGLQRPQGLWVNGKPDFEGIGAWLLDLYLGERLLGASDDQAKQKITEGIKSSDEWRQKHPTGN